MFRLFLAVALFLAACQPPPLNQPYSPIAAPSRVWLPLLGGGPVATATPVPTPTLALDCWPGVAERAFYQRLVNDPRQQRPRLICDTRLVAAAQRRALAQPPTGLSHCDSLGICANVYARAAGCQLPATYAPNGNNIESLGLGTVNVDVMYKAMVDNSPSHRLHLMGEGGGFREQDRIGIALVDVPTNQYRYVWVILIARCGE